MDQPWISLGSGFHIVQKPKVLLGSALDQVGSAAQTCGKTHILPDAASCVVGWFALWLAGWLAGLVGWLLCSLVNWLVVGLVGRLVGRPLGRLVGWVGGWLVGWLAGWLDVLVCCLVSWFVG